MTLDNLIGLSLERIEPDPLMIQRLLQAAQTCLDDAAIDTLSNENRFDIAYKAIMQLANAALQANGFRTLSSKPGHHQTMIQTLPKTIGLEIDTMIELDAMRKQRNVTDYSGDLVTGKEQQACLLLAHSLWDQVNDWLQQNHPELLV